MDWLDFVTDVNINSIWVYITKITIFHYQTTHVVVSFDAVNRGISLLLEIGCLTLLFITIYFSKYFCVELKINGLVISNISQSC